MMYVENIVFDNIMHIVMNSYWTKDNDKVMVDLEEYYECPDLNLQLLRDGR